jgi:hypothetical protein
LKVLYVFLVLAHDRRRILHFGITAHPTVEWTARQLREAFPWDSATKYLLRDRDRSFGADFTKEVEDLGIKGNALGSAFTMAAGIRRAGHRIDPARVSGPSDRV